MTELDAAHIKVAVDAVLARARLPVTADDYERLLGLYPTLEAQCAALRSVDVRNFEPAVIYQARAAG